VTSSHCTLSRMSKVLLASMGFVLATVRSSASLSAEILLTDKASFKTNSTRAVSLGFIVSLEWGCSSGCSSVTVTACFGLVSIVALPGVTLYSGKSEVWDSEKGDVVITSSRSCCLDWATTDGIDDNGLNSLLLSRTSGVWVIGAFLVCCIFTVAYSGVPWSQSWGTVCSS